MQGLWIVWIKPWNQLLPPREARNVCQNCECTDAVGGNAANANRNFTVRSTKELAELAGVSESTIETVRAAVA